MFYSDMDILVSREQYLDRLQDAARERLIRKIQQSNQKRARLNIREVVSWLLKTIPKRAINLEQEKSQLV